MKGQIKNRLAILLAILIALTLSGTIADAESISTTNDVVPQNFSQFGESGRVSVENLLKV
jgi:hypothetical protein